MRTHKESAIFIPLPISSIQFYTAYYIILLLLSHSLLCGHINQLHVCKSIGDNDPSNVQIEMTQDKKCMTRDRKAQIDYDCMKISDFLRSQYCV